MNDRKKDLKMNENFKVEVEDKNSIEDSKINDLHHNMVKKTT